MGTGASSFDDDDYNYRRGHRGYHHPHMPQRLIIIPPHSHFPVQTPPPPPPPPPPRVLVMRNDIALRRDSVKLVPAGTPNIYTLNFIYDSMTEWRLTLYLLVKETLNPITNVTTRFDAFVPNLPEPRTVNMQPGLNAHFEDDSFTIDLSRATPSVIKTHKEDQYGLVIRMEKKDSSLRELKVMYNYLEFEDKSGRWDIKIKRQKMEWNGEAYEVQEIYGLESSDLKPTAARIDDQNKECAVCLSEKIDTVVIPCRHMCLCIECAKALSVAQTGKKCPICRIDIESFVNLTQAPTPQPNQSQARPPNPSQMGYVPNGKTH